MKTFKCNFGNGVCAVLTTTDDPPKPEEKKSHIQRVDWIGNAKKVNPNSYVAWINSVNSVLAAEWGIRIMHVFASGTDMKDAQVWIYDPGEPPKLIPTPQFSEQVRANCIGTLVHERNPLHLPPPSFS